MKSLKESNLSCIAIFLSMTLLMSCTENTGDTIENKENNTKESVSITEHSDSIVTTKTDTQKVTTTTSTTPQTTIITTTTTPEIKYVNNYKDDFVDKREFYIEKVVVYDAKKEYYFPEGCLDKVQKVSCYTSDLNEIEIEYSYDAKENMLTVCCEHPDEIYSLDISSSENSYYKMQRNGYDGMICKKEGCEYVAYYYKEEDFRNIKQRIIKTEYYEDKAVVYFSEGSLDSVHSVICYASDLSEIENEYSFTMEGNALTVYCDEAEKISGLNLGIYENDYLKIRHLDSYAVGMLWEKCVGNAGYVSFEQSYYKSDEIAGQDELNMMKEEFSRELSEIAGVWENAEHTFKVEIKENERGRYIEEYEKVEEQWCMYNITRIDYIDVMYYSDGRLGVTITTDDGVRRNKSFSVENYYTEIEWSAKDESFIVYRQ